MYQYPYPRPMVTVDAVVFAVDGRLARVLLIQRGKAPFAGSWALPGGYVEEAEGIEAAAARELAEETGLTGLTLHQFHTYGAPGRDPRGRTLSVAHVATVASAPVVSGGSDARAARWFELDGLPPLAFDHGVIIADGWRYAQKELLDGHH